MFVWYFYEQDELVESVKLVVWMVEYVELKLDIVYKYLN